MLGSTVLDVAIGMCLVYLLFSFICSAVSELIEAFTRNRAADLERGIHELLNGDKTALQQLYCHPLICSLFANKYQSALGKPWWMPKSGLPSYIPTRNFILAILDLAIPAGPGQVSGASLELTSLREGILKSDVLSARTQHALVTLVDAANQDMTKARENIESWFNSAMDRVSGWYKRRTQAIIAVFALLAAAAINVDSIALVNSLATDRSVRDALVATAEEYAKKNTTIDSASILQLENRGLNIGWNSPRAVPVDWRTWFLKVLGWMLTACAATLGAPFWFDLLNKFIVVRSTVKPHEKSPEEPPKV